MALLASLLD
jgi:hypothetical protein